MKTSFTRWLASLTGRRARLDEMLAILSIAGVCYIIAATAEFIMNPSLLALTYAVIGVFFFVPGARAYTAEITRQTATSDQIEKKDAIVRRQLPQLLIGLAIFITFYGGTLTDATSRVPVLVATFGVVVGIVYSAEILIRLNLFKAGDKDREQLAHLVRLLERHSAEEALRLCERQEQEEKN